MSLSRAPRRRILVGGVATAVILGAGALALPALAEETGSITGHFTEGGAPVPASVALYDDNLVVIASAGLDESGGFTFAGLDPGDYRVGFSADSFQQYAVQKTRLADADAITVAAGQTTVVEEEKLPTGALTGTITDPDGTPASGVRVFVEAVGDGGFLSFPTDSDGTFDVPFVTPGDYRVGFSYEFNPQEWAYGRTSRETADVVTVTAGATTTVDAQLIGVGQLSGRLLAADGTPVAGVTVLARRFSDGAFAGFNTTDSTGRYSMRLLNGDYMLMFFTVWGTVWATGRSSEQDADPITVLGETTHDEILAELGSVEVSARNRATGQPIVAFCATTIIVNGMSQCTETGVVSLDLLPGSFTLSVFSPDNSFLTSEIGVTVASGVPTTVTVDLEPAASVTATVVDKESGAPVENACLELVPVNSPTTLGNGNTYCSDAGGALTGRPVDPGTYVAFVWADDGVHGHQWVGRDGGKGEFEKARVFTVAPGQAVTLPLIRLDAAGGEITGAVTDEATGTPASFGYVSLSSINPGAGPGRANFPVDEEGHYTVSGLGPYQWTLVVTAPPGYAYEWSGDSATRARAKTVNVKKDTAVTYDIAIGPGTTVTGRVTDLSGTPADSARLIFVNVDSRDTVGIVNLFDALVLGQYTGNVKGEQRVKVFYEVGVGSEFHSGWAGGATFEEATTFTIPTSGSVTIDVVATGPPVEG